MTSAPAREPTRRLAGSALCVATGALAFATAAIAAPHGAIRLHRAPTHATPSNVINVGDTYNDTIQASCYDANGNPLPDTVTLSVTGAPDTGGATATFTPNPVATFTDSAFAVVTTKQTDAKVYSMVVSGTGPACGSYGSVTLPLTVNPVLSLSRRDLVTVVATGDPANGGAFAYQSAPVNGTLISPIAMADGVTASTNPNTTQLSDPANPSGSGAPTPGALGKYTVDYTVNGLRATNDKSNPFKVPVFGTSCYYTALESDWGSPPNQCKRVRIHGTVYSGSVTDPYGYPGTYCASFIAEVVLQGSAVTNAGTDIQYDPSTNLIRQVSAITGADGTAVVAGQTVARSKTIIPSHGVLVDVHNIANGMLANDTGGAIRGYRLDLYRGAGAAVCSGYANPMAVSACHPQQGSTCPGSDLQ
jgi:3D (Asp-Asp-Asp) domain-containing protein